MAGLALGAIGSMIGGYIAPGVIGMGLTGASVGWMVGSMIGNSLQKGPTVEGPRAGDLSAQYSSYGAAIPRHYGRNRFAGNVIYCTDPIREVVNESRQGGKGGPKSTVREYSYNADVAIGLADCRHTGPITGIAKIWSNGKLIYDTSDTASPETLIASSARARSFKIYYGTDDQMPDPTLEAAKGVGNVPAYRGLAYVVFEGLDCPYARVPQLEFEVISNGGHTVVVQTVIGPNVAPFGTSSGGGYIDEDMAFTFARGASSEILARKDIYLVRQDLSGAAPIYFKSHPNVWAPDIKGNIDEPGVIWRYRSTGGSYGSLMFESMTGALYAYGDPSSMGSLANGFAFAKMSGRAILIGEIDRIVDVWVDPGAPVSIPPAFPVGSPMLGQINTFPMWGQSAWVTPSWIYIASSVNSNGSGDMQIARYDRDTLELEDILSWTSAETDMPSAVNFAVHVESPNKIWLKARSNTEVFVYDGEATLTEYPAVTVSTAVDAIRGDGDILVIGTQGGYNGDPNYPVLYVVNFNGISGTDYPVASFLEIEAQVGGLDISQVDTTGISDTFIGYTIGKLTSPRASMEPMLTAFQIDTFESDAKRKFRKRKDQPIAAEIPYEELGAVEFEAEAIDPVVLSTESAEELPRRVTVAYVNVNADYQMGAESANREVVQSFYDTRVEMPIVTDSDHAATVAQRVLYNLWNERYKRTIQLTRKYARLDPADHVLIEYPQGTWTRQIITSYSDSGYLISITTVPAALDLYEGEAAGTPGDFGQTVTPIAARARLILLDAHILRDADNNSGIYVPIDGLGSNFPGALLLEGPDPSSMEVRGGTSLPAPIGFATTALGDWPMEVMDETNVLTVQFQPFVNVPSYTREEALNYRAGAVAVGQDGRWEYMQYIRADLVANGVWRLTGLLRGARNTQQFRSTHQAGDTVVLLEPLGIVRPVNDLGELNQTRYYQAVTSGREIDQSDMVTGVNKAVGLKPDPGYNLDSTRNGSNDITATWDRRTRLSDQWWLGNVPLGEASERYEMVIYTNNTYATERRSILVTARTATYTSAMQTADGVTPGATAYVRIFQLSDTVGRGFPLQGAI